MSCGEKPGEPLFFAANQPGFQPLALPPPMIWGPGDMLSRQLPAVLRPGQFAFIDRGEFSYATCHVDNLAESVSLSLGRGTEKYRY